MGKVAGDKVMVLTKIGLTESWVQATLQEDLTPDKTTVRVLYASGIERTVAREKILED